ncbi:MAG: polyribonucleotide nucleotidyltransferase [Stygiobacter sp. RIFOXYC12_FULL_38_8]|nr:MAG: polyribonucleotide nucleotidyltransferase [Stygiobacter sp. GWC2_38_9]OGU85437.1 MAG: polyribonucleotide nucleotidyltransferase [Stygiobacter sp. RIFOXYA12_FULL_38_9]OGV08184.1 MAG: polyribonucleotide nucleotidyltransferase [Stygiobacter sp. RIFOXYB2_FULL_37_11]OGV11291.1 MAG: polyribonucleotide nucleotidyltransferase [Stygiobacter sp. RIFOXYA2_FULL_38_8]OGV15700.1 MAG: polyribonucleotide nucleotidyltransferase [Stygiobacter sp. RIFOXYC2_FULL_38_25]OGV23217.1 MAG: polyribonucleotide nu
MVVTKEIQIGKHKLIFETGKLAKQANGAIMARYGDTMVLVTAVAGGLKEDIDFFPLSVEYREKAFAAGKIPGGFFKREGKPSDREVLSARLIDRPIRPLFDDNYRNDTQVAAFVYSFDGENDPDVIAACAASAALAVSDIPFLEPIGEVRVGRVNGEFIINPTFQEVEESDIELVVAGTETSIMMVEGESKEVSESDLLSALKFAHQEIKKIVEVQKELREACGKPKMEVVAKTLDENLVADVNTLAHDKFKAIVSSVLAKEERSKANHDLGDEVLAALAEKYPGQEKVIGQILHDMEKDLMRKRILEEGMRLDGRNTKQIRPITCELGLLPRVHGTALFTRGETQSLTTLTLGTKQDEQIIDGLQDEYKKRFLLHYNFPPFSVGETGRFSGVGRREVGHGNLAERSLKNILPPEEKFPYTVRINSDILESNGSSSMATVCAGSLAMMDGGVPVKCAIAGIAMGLIKEGDKFAILSDILGNEDHLGDMDFKVAGSTNGITGLQMDIKIQGISYEIMETALAQAKEGRFHILGIMNEAISTARESISTYAPSILSTKIPVDKIGALIGPGGKVIQRIQKDFSVEISVEEDGTVNIAGQDSKLAKEAKEYIKLMMSEPEIGKAYNAKVISIKDFGAFVEFMPGIQGLLHISQVDTKKIAKVSDILAEGEMVRVKLLSIENGKYALSRKVLLKEKEEVKEENNTENAE